MASKSKLIIGFMVAALIAVIAATTWLGADLYRFAHRPAAAGADTVVFSISPGESLGLICRRLHEAELISDAGRFMLLARLKGDDKRLKAGEYRLSASVPPLALLETLVSGSVHLHVLTIPEGYTYKQIADEIRRIKLTDADQFLALAADHQVVKDFGLEGPTLEGYLFPDTYHFPKNIPARALIAKMIERFQDQFPEAWHQRARELGMSLLEVVTLASIIEKETGAPSERQVIASVFHNRLRKKMRLETDPTVIYGIADFDGNLTRKDLRTKTPYNTYMIRGLPPGPIANPGRPAIEAALYPSQTDYLYFVAKKDGTHQFSTNIKDHNAAVRKYQLRRRRK